jgi:UDP-N-acetylmuramyl pentapeptide phosphotransferase/UDP-N-acetylglucosamine-1-phosphate transferase
MLLSGYLIVFAVCLVAGVVIVRTHNLHGHLSGDSVLGVQKMHTHNTSRIGGIAIAMGLLAVWLLVEHDVKAVLTPMLIAGIPAFVFGLAEDLTKEVSVLKRLLATMTSGLLACYLTGIAMQDTGLPPLDWLLQWMPLAMLFTAFAVGGVANAINIIDGFNGLAAGSLAIMLGALGLMALRLGDVPVATVSFAVACCALGFGAVNWPLGKLFLGDGGAYLMGFLLAWLAILLPMRHKEVNAFATLLVCAYPVLDVAFSVRRRIKREGHHLSQPDRAHLHHFIYRRVVRQLFPHLAPRLQNGLTSPFCWLLVALPAGLAVVFMQNTGALAACFVLSTCLYAAIYTRLTQFRWSFWR